MKSSVIGQSLTGILSLADMVEAEKLNRGYMGRLLQLTLLTAEFIEAVLNGTYGPELALPRLMEPLSPSWAEQRALVP